MTENTTIGRAAKQYLAKGDLVPDAIVMDMLRKPTVAASEAGGYVLDGFPRTVDQAEAAYETARGLGVAVEVAVFLEVPAAELTRRLLARGRGQDDTPEVIEHRLRSSRRRPGRCSTTTPSARSSSRSTAPDRSRRSPGRSPCSCSSCAAGPPRAADHGADPCLSPQADHGADPCLSRRADRGANPCLSRQADHGADPCLSQESDRRPGRWPSWPRSPSVPRPQAGGWLRWQLVGVRRRLGVAGGAVRLPLEHVVRLEVRRGLVRDLRAPSPRR